MYVLYFLRFINKDKYLLNFNVMLVVFKYFFYFVLFLVIDKFIFLKNVMES